MYIFLKKLRFTFLCCRTWSGPSWSPAQSLSSVLISIQSLMNEKPYHNEPGFEQVFTFNYVNLLPCKVGVDILFF